MAVNSIGSTSTINDLTSTNSTNNTQQTDQVVSDPNSSTGALADTTMTASLMASQLQAAAPLTTTSTSPALAPRATFQQPVVNFLANIFRIPASQIDLRNTSFAVNSAGGLQSVDVAFLDGGRLRLFLGLPGQSPTGQPNPNGAQTPFPPTTTAQIPRVYLGPPEGVLNLRNMGALTLDQKNQIANLYAKDQVSRGNYAANLQNIVGALNQIKATSTLDAATTSLINNQISSLRTAYNQLANFAGRSPDPDTVYKQVTNTLNTLFKNPAVNRNSLTDALNITGIGYSNYLFNRLPINGTNNPATTTRGALPAFNANFQLAQAQSNPAAVFGAGLTSYLNSVGIRNINPASVNYQVNSANAIQAAAVPLGNGTLMTLLFNGPFPPTNANPPQVVFKSTDTARQFARVSVNDPAVASRLRTFFTNNAAPRAAYVTNLNNLISGLTTVRNSGALPDTVRNSVSATITALQRAVTGLNASTPIVPDVLALYKRVGATLDAVTGTTSTLNTTQRGALDTLNRSTFPIGINNYFLRPVILSQPAPTTT